MDKTNNYSMNDMIYLSSVQFPDWQDCQLSFFKHLLNMYNGEELASLKIYFSTSTRWCFVVLAVTVVPDNFLDEEFLGNFPGFKYGLHKLIVKHSFSRLYHTISIMRLSEI